MDIFFTNFFGVLQLCFANDGARYFLTHFAQCLPGLAFIFYIANVHFFHPRLHQVHINENTYVDPIIVKEIDLFEI